MTSSPHPHPAQNNDEIDIVDLIGALWEGKWIIIGVTALITLLGVAYVYMTPQPPTATLTFEVSKSAQIPALFATMSSGDSSKLNAQPIEIAKDSIKATDWPAGLSLSSVSSDEEGTQIDVSYSVSDTFTPAENWLPASLDKINLEISEELFKELESTAQEERLSFLTNQLELARAVGQIKSIFQTGAEQSTIVLTAEGLPYYLNGTIAIETEIAQLKRRTSEIDAQLAAARLNGLEFLSASENGLVISKPARSMRSLLLAFLAGGFLSLIILVVWRSLQTYWERNPES